MYLKIYLSLYSCPIHIFSCTKHIISGPLYPVYKNDDESDPGNSRPMSLLSIFSRMYHRLIRAYNHGQKLLIHENYQRFSLV